jgi:prepilin signal peptidase PulO-like enzyme (type II secretory pathway)
VILYNFTVIASSLLLHVSFGWVLVFKPGLLSQNLSKRTYQKPYWIILLLGSLGVGLTWLMLSFSATNSIFLIPELLLLHILFWVSITDILSCIIPNRILFFGLVSWVLIVLIEPPIFNGWNLGIALFTGVGFVVINMVSKYIAGKQGFGYGDIKLFVLLGIFLGAKVIIVLLLAIILSGFCSVILLLAGILTRKSRLPFAPFILPGYLIFLFPFTQNMIYNYLQLIL